LLLLLLLHPSVSSLQHFRWDLELHLSASDRDAQRTHYE
jgi:hypothetical protein